jgi:hypothetical protein
MQQLNIFGGRGNTGLFQYGIFEEESDYRIHVCVHIKKAYCYPTILMREMLRFNGGNFQKRNAYQGGIKTAEGYIVPINFIPDIQEIDIPELLVVRYPIGEKQTTTIKGRNAVSIASALLEGGLVRVAVSVDEIQDLDLQIKGQDAQVVVNSGIVFQIKCDMKGGSKKHGGTGNLFVQTHECNPNHLH